MRDLDKLVFSTFVLYVIARRTLVRRGNLLHSLMKEITTVATLLRNDKCIISLKKFLYANIIKKALSSIVFSYFWPCNIDFLKSLLLINSALIFYKSGISVGRILAKMVKKCLKLSNIHPKTPHFSGLTRSAWANAPPTNSCQCPHRRLAVRLTVRPIP
jgi:hypothetical protein